MRLPPRGRQPDGSYARNLRAWILHRQSCGCRGTVRSNPFRPLCLYRVGWKTSIPRPFWRAQYGKPGKVDRWQIIHFEAPRTITIDVGVAAAGTGAKGGDRSKGVNGYVLNTITPSTEKTCLYFWAFARNYDLHSQARTHALREGVAGVFRENETVLEAQPLAIGASPDHQFYSLNIDAGSIGTQAHRPDDRGRPVCRVAPGSE